MERGTRMKAKKLVSFVLAAVMLMTAIVPAFAVDANASDVIRQQKIEAEIESEKDRIFTSVYEQLKEQDALGLMDIYVEILTPRIEATVYASYGLESVATQASDAYFYNGGTVGYTNFNADVLDTYFTAEQYRSYMNENSDVLAGAKDFVTSSAVDYIIKKYNLSLNYAAVIGGWGVVFGMLMAASVAVTESAKKSVNSADGYASIISVSTAGGAEKGTTIIGWKNHPIVTVPDTAKNVNKVQFY